MSERCAERHNVRLLALLSVLFSLSVIGCASDRNEHPMDGLWKQGYGYNNPNVDRLRNGQTPVGFDE